MKTVFFEKDIFTSTTWELLELKMMQIAYKRLTKKGVIGQIYIDSFIDAVMKGSSKKNLMLLDILFSKIPIDHLIKMRTYKEERLLSLLVKKSNSES